MLKFKLLPKSEEKATEPHTRRLSDFQTSPLSEQGHFSNLRKAARLQLVEINSTGYRISVAILTVPMNGVKTGFELSVRQSANLLAKGVEDSYKDLADLGKLEVNFRFRIKWVGVVLLQRKFLRYGRLFCRTPSPIVVAGFGKSGAADCPR